MSVLPTWAAQRSPQPALKLSVSSTQLTPLMAHRCIATPPDEITYSIYLTNTAAVTATQVVLTDILPSGAVYVRDSAIPSATLVASDTLVWQIAELPPDRAITASVTAQMPEGRESPFAFETFSNTALVSSDQTPLSTSLPFVISRSPIPADAGSFCVTQSDNTEVAFAGGVIRYTLNYDFRPGFVFPGYTQTVVLADTLPTHTHLIAELSTPGWACEAANCLLPAAISGSQGVTGVATITLSIDPDMPPDTRRLVNLVNTSDGFLSEITPLVPANMIYLPIVFTQP